MQFAKISFIIACVTGLGLAGRADTIKAGLRIVNGHQTDKYHDTQAKMRNDVANGNHRNLFGDVGRATTAKNNANNIAKAVGGDVRRPRRSLEFLGSDETHEYFARSIEDDEDIFYTRSIDDEFEEYY